VVTPIVMSPTNSFMIGWTPRIALNDPPAGRLQTLHVKLKRNAAAVSLSTISGYSRPTALWL
jgi:hypothetical protein